MAELIPLALAAAALWWYKRPMPAPGPGAPTRQRPASREHDIDASVQSWQSQAAEWAHAGAAQRNRDAKADAARGWRPTKLGTRQIHTSPWK